MIDSIHKEVFEIINHIARLICNKDIPGLQEAFALLEQSLAEYFATEAKVAQAVGFDFDNHVLAHQALLKDIRHKKTELVERNGLWSKSEEKIHIDSLRNCFISHIKEDSNPLKILLETHYYDFKPD